VTNFAQRDNPPKRCGACDLVAVGYMDPGNWATDIAGGSAYGYALLSVILLSNIATR
jgi:Mn2+/Fe2+ NRAMP family transporter